MDQTLQQIVESLKRHRPPQTLLCFKIVNPKSPQLYIHGIHGSGKTTIANSIVKDVPDCAYVDENYEGIHKIVMEGGDITKNVSAMFDQRKLPKRCIVDRSAIDNLAYEKVRWSNGEPSLYFNTTYGQVLFSTPAQPYLHKYFTTNHVWLFPECLQLVRDNVLQRGREWDDSVEMEHLYQLEESYLWLYAKLN